MAGEYVATYESLMATDGSVGNVRTPWGSRLGRCGWAPKKWLSGSAQCLASINNLIIGPGSPYWSQAGALAAARDAVTSLVQSPHRPITAPVPERIGTVGQSESLGAGLDGDWPSGIRCNCAHLC